MKIHQELWSVGSTMQRYFIAILYKREWVYIYIDIYIYIYIRDEIDMDNRFEIDVLLMHSILLFKIDLFSINLHIKSFKMPQTRPLYLFS